MANTPNHDPDAMASAKYTETGIVAEAVDDSEMLVTAYALRDKNREVEATNRENDALRRELLSSRLLNNCCSLFTFIRFAAFIFS